MRPCKWTTAISKEETHQSGLLFSEVKRTAFVRKKPQFWDPCYAAQKA
jgi:hypothetical protein